MTSPNAQESSHRPRRGLWLLIGGLVVAGFFLTFLLISQSAATSLTPMWIGVAWGALMAVWGLYRLLKGPSKLDHPQGGTDAGA